MVSSIGLGKEENQHFHSKLTIPFALANEIKVAANSTPQDNLSVQFFLCMDIVVVV